MTPEKSQNLIADYLHEYRRTSGKDNVKVEYIKGWYWITGTWTNRKVREKTLTKYLLNLRNRPDYVKETV